MTSQPNEESKLNNRDGSKTNYGKFSELVNEIYALDGYVGSSLRYYYYIANSRGLFTPGIKNADKIFSDELMKARDFGRVPWDAITDDSRPVGGNVKGYISDNEYVQIAINYLKNAHKGYTLPMRYLQPIHLEVWLEKIALRPKFEAVLNGLDIPIPIQKGYSSGGSLNYNQKRIKEFLKKHPHKRKVVIQYWGDWNPSGSDIERNVIERLTKFGVQVEFSRIAVNQLDMDEYELPTTTAKKSDTRYDNWLKNVTNGDDRTTDLDSFVALDHIKPDKPFTTLLRNSVLDKRLFDKDVYNEQLELQEKLRRRIGGLVKKRVRFLDD